jgi:hypothetical protein
MGKLTGFMILGTPLGGAYKIKKAGPVYVFYRK